MQIYKPKTCRRSVAKDRRWLAHQTPTLLDDTSYYTRGQAAARLDLSPTTFRRQAKRHWWGELELYGKYYYEVESIEFARDLRGLNTKLPDNPTKGEIYAVLFCCFSLGKSKRELVGQMHLEPKFIRDAHEEWKRNDLDADYNERKTAEYEKAKLKELKQMDRAVGESERNYTELMRVIKAGDRKQ